MVAESTSGRYPLRLVTRVSGDDGVQRRGIWQVAQREPIDDWPQLRLALVWPEQHAHELIRHVVLFGRSPIRAPPPAGKASLMSTGGTDRWRS